ncbi:hypothetical protein [Rhizobium leguminosarum]|uniref:hypothetical protein n=1 Tax=Rhizobium leguminosarum TaxID=384 RepID=UPI001C945957|nr:hypothetical protein [Rhizobium leguminosarum]MBY5694684.1 hypothetical protein [Rhizobium leguminosarum]
MPIIYMHGVNTRDAKHFEPVHEYLRRIVAPSIAPDPENVSISAADWFQLCDAPKWGGIARPATSLLGQGAEVERRELLDAIVAKLPRSGPPNSSLTSGQVATANQYSRVEGLTPDDLADLITVSVASNSVDGLQRARIGIAADRVARNQAIQRSVQDASSLEEQLAILAASVQADVEQQSALAGQGAAQFLRGMRDRVNESLSRTIGSPLAVAGLIAGELRPTLNDFVTRFVGDLLFYMTLRGTANAPGAIPKVLISELESAAETKRKRAGEPTVLLTHSMGGQIAYDVLTSFLPAASSEVKVDFWCATASQVGYFEELNMFLASSKKFSRASGLLTPLPYAHLGRWWNVWDPNDIISFTTKGIFADGIDDEKYWSGMSLAAAHGGYLERPSFYRRFADKLKTAFPGGGPSWR